MGGDCVLSFESFGLDVLSVPLRGNIAYDVTRGVVRFCYVYDSGVFYPLPLDGYRDGELYRVEPRYRDLLTSGWLFAMGHDGSSVVRSLADGIGLYKVLGGMKHAVAVMHYGFDVVHHVESLIVFANWFITKMYRVTVMAWLVAGGS